MERYFYYYLACVPLCIPSFLIVFKVVKRKLLESVFNQQIVLMILLNGKYNRNLVQMSDQIDPDFSNYNLDILPAGLYVVLTSSLSLYILFSPCEKRLPCEILINLRTSYLVSIMACGTVAVMFRSTFPFIWEK